MVKKFNSIVVVSALFFLILGGFITYLYFPKILISFNSNNTLMEITFKPQSDLCKWYDAIKNYNMSTTYSNGVDLKIICGKYDADVLNIEKLMKLNNHTYLIDVYDCTEFSQDFVNLNKYNATCIFGRLEGKAIVNGKIVDSYGYLLHDWAKVNINGNILQIDPTGKYFFFPPEEKNHKIISEGKCL